MGQDRTHEEPLSDDDFFPPEEAARRFNAALLLCMLSPPIPAEKIKGRRRKEPTEQIHEIPTQELERRAGVRMAQAGYGSMADQINMILGEPEKKKRKRKT